MSGRTDTEVLKDQFTVPLHGDAAALEPPAPGDTPLPMPVMPNTARNRLVLADAAAVIVGIALAFAVQRVVRPVPSWILASHALLVVASLPGFIAGALFNRLYLSRANARPVEEAKNVLRAVAVGVGVIVLIAFGIQFKDLSRLWVFLVAASVAAVLLAERQVARRQFDRLRTEGRLRRRILIVGTDPHAIGLMHTYQRNPALGYDVAGFIGDDELGDRGGVGVLGPIDDLRTIMAEQDVCGVVVSLGSVGQDHVNRLTRELTDDGYHVVLSSSLRDIDITRIRPQALDGNTMIYVEPVIRGGWRAVAKRAFDVVTAALILVLSSPLLLAAAIAIKLEDGGPILFRQERVGRGGRSFSLTTLRTMVVDADEMKADLLDQSEVDGPLFKMTNDPRITRSGRLLRKLSIDELPQLVAVLRGTMSMVGPRPALPDEVAQWDGELRDRLRVLPGLTGMWQVSGRSDTSFEQYRRLDLYYVDNWSLGHDLRICAKTVGVVLTGRGAS
ncbi:sugar transferase [Ilumatobacter sp.]|uniref:sugar transferase n=1 Tax=Ilumatobacter sp. TaxID=1967498 RepID=UPI003AF81C39